MTAGDSDEGMDTSGERNEETPMSPLLVIDSAVQETEAMELGSPAPSLTFSPSNEMPQSELQAGEYDGRDSVVLVDAGGWPILPGRAHETETDEPEKAQMACLPGYSQNSMQAQVEPGTCAGGWPLHPTPEPTDAAKTTADLKIDLTSTSQDDVKVHDMMMANHAAADQVSRQLLGLGLGGDPAGGTSEPGPQQKKQRKRQLDK